MGEKTKWYSDRSPDNRFPYAYGRCLATLVYLRARALGECLRVDGMHFLDAGR